MFKFLRENRNILMVAFGLFIASMSTVMIFLNDGQVSPHEIKTDVVDALNTQQNMQDENTYRSYLKDSEDPFIVIGVDGKVVFVSWDYLSESGYGQNDFKDKSFFELLSADDTAVFMSSFGKALKDGNPISPVGPFKLRDAKGDYHFNIGSMVPISENGSVDKIILSVRDITPQLQNGGTDGEDSNAKTDNTKSFPGKKIKEQQSQDGMTNKFASTT